MIIGIFGSPHDDEANALCKRLKNRGVTPIVIDLATFPEKSDICGVDNTWYFNDVDIMDISAAFLRSRGSWLPPFVDYEKGLHGITEKNSSILYSDLYTSIRRSIDIQIITCSLLHFYARHRPLVNPVEKNDLHRLKISLFSFLKKRHCQIPDYCAGTSKDALLDFTRQQNRSETGVVQKPVAGIYKTFLWKKKLFKQHPWSTRGSFYQMYVRGDTIRCYVVGGKLVAAAKIIHGGTVDSSISQTGIEVLDLPAHACSIAEQCAKHLDLSFCGIDLMYELSSGNYYLIDCNISPMFVNFSRASGIDIAAYIADHLIEIATGSSKGHSRSNSMLREIKDIIATDPKIRNQLWKRTKSTKTGFTIAVAGSKRDRHVISLQSELEKRGCRVPCLDFNSFPRFNILNLFPDATYDDITVQEILTLDKIDLLLIRNIPVSVPEPVSRDSFITTTRQERSVTMLKYCTIAYCKRKIPVINTLEAGMYHRLKAYQYYILHQNGITVPKTLVTSSISDARRFTKQFDNLVIAKPNTSAAEVVMADDRFFESMKTIIPNRPFIFQQFVSGKSYRCYLLGGCVVSCGRLFFDRTHVDWREKVDRIESCGLTSSVERELIRAVKLLQLAYCAVDIEYDIRTGKHYFLDFNPGGLFSGWSKMVDINMAGLIAEYLIEVIRNDDIIWR